MNKLNEIDIINLALANIGEVQVVSLTGITFAERMARISITKNANKLLREFAWSFAVKEFDCVKLSESVISTSFTSVYLLPDDCVRVIGLQDEQQPYKIYANCIYTNADRCVVVYVSNSGDFSTYDAFFIECLLNLLTADLALSIAHDVNLSSHFEQRYIQSLSKAQSVNAIENRYELRRRIVQGPKVNLMEGRN